MMRATGDGFGVMTAPEILALPDIPVVPEGVVSEYVRRVEDGAVVRLVRYPASGCETAEVVG